AGALTGVRRSAAQAAQLRATSAAPTSHPRFIDVPARAGIQDSVRVAALLCQFRNNFAQKSSGGATLLDKRAPDHPPQKSDFVSATKTPFQSSGGAVSRKAPMRVRYKSNNAIKPKLGSVERHNSMASNAPSQSRLR